MWWIDAIFIAIIVIFAIVGLAKGFFDSILSLVSTGVAVGLAIWLARPASTLILKIMPLNKWYGDMLSGQSDPMIIFGHELSLDKVAGFLTLVTAGVIVFLLVKLVIYLLAKLFDSATKNSTALSGLNRVLGLLFGTVKGAILAVTCLGVISLISQVTVLEKVGTAVSESSVAGWVYKYVDEFVDNNLTKANLEDLLEKVVGSDTPANSSSSSTVSSPVLEYNVDGTNYTITM